MSQQEKVHTIDGLLGEQRNKKNKQTMRVLDLSFTNRTAGKERSVWRHRRETDGRGGFGGGGPALT